MSKQKSYYKSVVLTNLGLLLWIIGVINIIIFALITKNEILTIVSVFVSFLGLIIFIIDDNLNLFFRRSYVYPTLFYKYDLYGVPNNCYKEFGVKACDLLLNNNIIVKETSNSVFESNINGYDLIFDLCGWHNKSYCLYEYFLSVIQTELAKHNYKKIKKPIFVKNVKNLTLTVIYKNKKKKIINLIKNNKTTLTFKFKIRLSIKCDILGTKKVFLKDLYKFNI